MFCCSFKNLIVALLLLCSVLTGCSTVAKAGRISNDPGDLLPGGCSLYLAGNIGSFSDKIPCFLKENGIPGKIIDATERIFCAVNKKEEVTVIMSGDYSGVPIRTCFSVKSRYVKKKGKGFYYWEDLKMGGAFFVPDKSIIMYTSCDIEELLKGYPFPENSYSRLNSAEEFSGLFTKEGFFYTEKRFTAGHDAEISCGIFLFITRSKDIYDIDSVLCFETPAQAKTIAVAVKLFVLDMMKKYGIGSKSGGKNVSAEGSKIVIKDLGVPFGLEDILFDPFISEIKKR